MKKKNGLKSPELECINRVINTTTINDMIALVESKEKVRDAIPLPVINVSDIKHCRSNLPRQPALQK